MGDVSSIAKAAEVALSRVSSQAADHPAATALVFAVILLLAATAIVLATPLFRTAVRKFFYLVRNAFTADRGPKDLVYWALVMALIAFPFAFVAGYKTGATAFDWPTFFFVLLVIMLGNGSRVVFESLSQSKMILRPLHGEVWRADRKIKTAGVLRRLALDIREHKDGPEEVKRLLTDLLSLVASHVRDHRGNHATAAVFASLLLVRDGDLVVVAREEQLLDGTLQRPTPVSYPKGQLAVSRAVDSGTVVSVGDYRLEYPEAPVGKPYVSILGIPLAGSDGTVIGAVSIDSARPYFFESFTPGIVENDLENSLAPYITTIVFVLEHLLPQPLDEKVRILEQAYERRRA